jgi:site-specific recombinase XerD
MTKKAKDQQIKAIFDSLEYLENQNDFSYLSDDYNIQDIKQAQMFLKSYKGSSDTLGSYRREIERLLQWSFLIAKKSLKTLKRDDIENYIEFCKNPPKSWISTHRYPRFIIQNSIRLPNLKWKPFLVKVNKTQRRKGEVPILKDFEFTQAALRQVFAIIGSFYEYLIQEEYVLTNPIKMIRQKSKFIRKLQNKPKIRRLSELQWQYVLDAARELAEQNPNLHERTLFIISALYAMYLRISELVANKRWAPKMSDFACDSDNNWWFTTVGKGNKQRQIAVSDAMLEALKRWRTHLTLTPPLPSPSDNTALIPKITGKGPISHTSSIRNIVQNCFDQSMTNLKTDGFTEEAESLMAATVHWLRHTGISDDVKIRPREHVRDDAGHSSSAITDKYIDIELRERHRSARRKTIEM